MTGPATVLRAGSVLTPAGELRSGAVTVRDGTILAVGPARDGGDVDPDTVLAPGFVDLQVNGIGTVDVARAEGPADWDRLDAALLAQGVTTWCPTLTSAPLDDLAAGVARVAAAAARPGGPRPHVAGVHLEGPFLTVAGAHPPEHLRDRVDPAWLGSLADHLAVCTLAPELDGALDAVAALARRGVLVSIGHSACSFERAGEAADHGARLVTHLGNASGPYHQRRPGLLGAALTDRRLAVGIIADLVHVHPGLLRLAFAAKGPTGTVLVTDAVAAEAGRVGPVTLAGATAGTAARLADGTLAGSVLQMHDGVANVVGAAGVPLADAVRAASTTPAARLGLHDRGVVAPGRRADLVELAPDPAGRLAVGRVWIGGRLARDGPLGAPR